MRRDVFVWHGEMCLKGGARGKLARDQRLDVRGQRSVRRGKHGNGARELSVLDCLLMGCSRSWELVGQALPLAGMAGRLPARRRLPLGENAYLQRSARSHRRD